MAGGIEIKGIDKLFKKLDKVAAQETLRPPMQRSVMRIQQDMAEYPETPTPGVWAAWVNSHSPEKAAAIRGAFFAQKWRGRTGTLGRRWTTKVTSNAKGLIGKIGNNTKYGPFAQSKQFQAGFHRDRFQTDVDVMERNKSEIVADFQRTIEKALR